MMRRFTALLLALIVGLPWAVMPVTAGSGCATAELGVAARNAQKKADACSYCAPAPRASSGRETFHASCCRFAPGTEASQAQAGGVSLTPKPLQSPEAPTAVLSGVTEVDAPNVVRIARAPNRRPAPHAPPTETTHLLL